MGKAHTGSLQSLENHLSRISPPGSPTSKARWKLEQVDTIIGKLSQYVTDPEDLVGSEASSETSMQSSPDLSPPSSMFGRMKLQSLEPDSNLDPNPFDATPRKTGMPSGRQLVPETSLPFLPMYAFVVTVHSKEFARIIWSRFLWCEVVQFFGVQPELAKVCVPGMKPVYKLTLKIPIRSSGVDTLVRNMLLSMNLEERSTSAICYDGWIGTQSEWSLKEQVSPLWPPSTGSQAICTPENGIQK